MLAANKLKMSGSEKESEQEHKQQFLGGEHTTFPPWKM